MKKHLEFLLDRFETEHFPTESCIVQDVREPEVLNSDKVFVCLIVDRRFDDIARLVLANPYIYKGSMLGWVATDGSEIFSHKDNSVNRNDDEIVIGWRETDVA
jgi:hypothetical protein